MVSFGWSAGDIAAAAQLLWNLHKALDDVDGAPEHYRRSAATLKSIQFRLRVLGKVAGEGETPDPLSEPEGANLLETVDRDDIHSMVTNLKLAIGKLEKLVASGCTIKLNPKSTRRRRDWPMHQINKLQWYIGKENQVNDLIQHIYELTSPLSDLYQKLESEFAKEQAVTQGVYHETQIKWLKAIYRKLTLVQNDVAQGQLINMDDDEKKERLPLLHAGPDLVVLPTTTGPELKRASAMSHLKDITRDFMSASLRTRVKNLRVDHQLRRKLVEWFSGKTSSLLWLYGDQASTISATIYTTALDRRRPVVAFAGQHIAAGQYLTGQDRLFKMVYSLLFQLLQQFDESLAFVITEVDKPFTELRLSTESMPLAMKYLGYFLSILPDCICIVDGWNFISNDADPIVRDCLKTFLDLFQKLGTATGDDDGGVRLLLTSPGNSQMLRDLGKQAVDSFDLRNHVDTNSGLRLHTVLLGMEW
ncbi:hypothetical protein F5X99DRAFT_370065 [Biscogniauxia marginata]|nr:hypothetical protein F5X99DRAFT_370065 [Biscogniauxia marginata]